MLNPMSIHVCVSKDSEPRTLDTCHVITHNLQHMA